MLMSKPEVLKNVTVFGDRVFGEVITLQGITEVGPNPVCLVSL